MGDIPLTYKDKCLIIRKVYYINELFTFLVTKKLELIEINKNQEIVNYIKLDSSNLKIDESDIIILKSYERLDSTLMLLFQLNDKIYIISRKKSVMKIIKVCHEVESFKIKGQVKHNENILLLKLKNGSMKETSFDASQFDTETRENNIELIKSIEYNIKYQMNRMIKTLKNITSKQQLQIYLMIGKQKFLPRFMRLDDPNDVSPLVRFGSIFSRVCNDKLVIGIPVFNASSLERRLLLENLKLIMFCPTLPNGAFRYDLFKMKTDCPSFEDFEKLFNEQYENEMGEISVPEKPEHKVEWSRCLEKSLLYACEAGVFVVIADIIQFVSDMNHTITFNVSYEIEGKLMNSKLIANIGQFSIDSKLIYSTQLDINQYSLEKYRNLLAITSTSEMIVALDISFEENERIENFFVKELNFEIIKSHEDIGGEQPSSYFENVNTKTVSLRLRQDYFLYASDGYFKGTLIRIRLESDELMKAKIYARAAHQVIMLLQSIYKQYPRCCKIKLSKVF